MKRKLDWAVFLSAIAGSCIGALALGYWAANRFKLYTFFEAGRAGRGFLTVIPERIYPGYTTGDGQNITSLPRVYDWEAIALWMVAGIIVGAYLGILAIALLRAVNRHAHQDTTQTHAP